MNDKFFIKDNKICLNTHKVVVRRYLDINKTDYVDETHCVDSDGLHELEVNFVPKHKLISIVSKEELDTSDYAWMEGIELTTDNVQKELDDIAACGSLEAYNASLPQTQDEFNLDIDYRMSKMELGL
jgi:hypothetical protein